MSRTRRRAQAGLLVLGVLAAVLATVAYAAGVTTAYQYDETGNLLQVMDVSSDVNNCGGIGSVCSANRSLVLHRPVHEPDR